MEINREGSGLDQEQAAGRFTLPKYILYLLPVIGFIGTVEGISKALMNISLVLPMVKDLDGFMSNLTSVTSALQVAFDSTLLALFLSAALMLVQTLVYKRSEDLLGPGRPLGGREDPAEGRIVERAPARGRRLRGPRPSPGGDEARPGGRAGAGDPVVAGALPPDGRRPRPARRAVRRVGQPAADRPSPASTKGRRRSIAWAATWPSSAPSTTASAEAWASSAGSRLP